MQSPELTVIVTCFNIAQFVPACLRSIFRQPQVERLRILVIDDGSVDETSKVVKAEIAAHPEVSCELVTQKNEGVSCARNTGVRLARTPYLTFVDGDDLWAANYLGLVWPIMDEGRADIIAYNASIVDMAGRRLDRLHFHTRFSREARFSCCELACDAARVGEWESWSRIYKTRLLDGACFPPGRYYEDVALLPALYAKASHIEALRDELYVYRRRPGSLNSLMTDKHIDDLLLHAREAMAHSSECTGYWRTVHRSMMLLLAHEIGRAPRALRRSMFSRAWPHVQMHPDLGFRLNWILRMLDVSLRSEVKSLLGLKRRPRPFRLDPSASGAPE